MTSRPVEVAAGQTTPTCGVTNAAAPPPEADGGHATGTAVTDRRLRTGRRHRVAVPPGAGRRLGSAGVGSGGAGGVDPGGLAVGSRRLAFTGGDPLPSSCSGLLLLVGGLDRRGAGFGAGEEAPMTTAVRSDLAHSVRPRRLLVAAVVGSRWRRAAARRGADHRPDTLSGRGVRSSSR